MPSGEIHFKFIQILFNFSKRFFIIYKMFIILLLSSILYSPRYSRINKMSTFGKERRKRYCLIRVRIASQPIGVWMVYVEISKFNPIAIFCNMQSTETKKWHKWLDVILDVERAAMVLWLTVEMLWKDKHLFTVAQLMWWFPL